MTKDFDVQWEGELPATPQEVWDAFTVHTAGWLWKIEYEPRVGGTEPIEGVLDYATHAFLGVRSGDALYRFYGRDAWGWPVGVAHHLFAEGVDAAASEQAWSAWLDGVFATEAVA
jgi:hypothetical protein